MDIYKSGKKGISWDRGSWRVHFGRNYYGRFKNLEDAIKKREEIELQYWGQCERPSLSNTCSQKFCKNCGNPTNFSGNSKRGYHDFCSIKCGAIFNNKNLNFLKNKSKATSKLWKEGKYKNVSMKGMYSPRNKAKYKGDINNIFYRSSYEFKFMTWLDDNPDIIQWSSEEIYIPYKDKATGRHRLYFPDFFYKTSTEQYLIEVKPHFETLPPKPRSNKKAYIKAVRTFATNSSKWAYAERYAKVTGMKFCIITERDLAKL